MLTISSAVQSSGRQDEILGATSSSSGFCDPATGQWTSGGGGGLGSVSSYWPTKTLAAHPLVSPTAVNHCHHQTILRHWKIASVALINDDKLMVFRHFLGGLFMPLQSPCPHWSPYRPRDVLLRGSILAFIGHSLVHRIQLTTALRWLCNNLQPHCPSCRGTLYMTTRQWSPLTSMLDLIKFRGHNRQ